MNFVSNRTIAEEVIYQLTQYRALEKATVTASAISMISSLLITISYIILRIKNPERSNRVSLRCVFLASCMNMIDSIFDLCSILINGDTAFCRSSAILTMFARVTSCVLLSLVGINLVLVFVVNIKSYTAARLEFGYYLGALLYGLITISVPISEEAKTALDPDAPLRCFYFVYFYQVLGHSSLLWMWYYAFLFFTTLVAIICSTIASIKLLREQHNLLNRFSDIVNLSETAEASDIHIQIRITNQSNVFKKVVTRCVLYPLVPFISNIWGFIAQLILVSGRTPSFVLSMLDNVFGCLQGFFVAIIFFSDPAMSEFICQGLRSWRQKKVDESINGKVQRDFNRIELVSSTNSSNIDMSKAKNNDLLGNNDTLIQTPSKTYSTKENQHSSSTTPARYDSRLNSFSSFDGYSVEKNNRASYYDDTATMVAQNDTPMHHLNVSHSTASHHSRNCSGDVNPSSSPVSAYGGSTIVSSERRASSLV